MSISSLYQQNLNDASRAALLSVVANNPSTSVRDLRELLGQYPSLGSMILAELVGQPATAKKSTGTSSKTSSVPAKPATATKPTVATAKPTSAKGPREEWNTRTNEGRAAIDQAVLQAMIGLGSVAVSSEMIRARIGGTPAQIRESLNRHIETGDISFSGKARGTRYTLET